MSIEMLLYCPPMEEEKVDVTGWNKETIEYVSKHKSKIHAQIRGIAKNTRKVIQTTDVEDIYSEVLMYLYNCDDYNISKAIERSHNNTMVTLDGYINVCIKFCVARYCIKLNKEEKETVHASISDEDGKELNILDNIADSKSIDTMDMILYDLETVCRSCEAIRYKYGPDIYLVWFIRLLTLNKENKNLYKDILNILGISKKELLKVEKYAVEDELMTTFARAIDISGVEESINIIRPYVFSARKIELTVSVYC